MKNKIKFLEENNFEKIVEWRKCKWTGEDFPIFEKDIEMLKKLSPMINGKKQNIPLPTLSPNARQIRRLLFRNEWNFYKSRSNKTGEPIISLYAPENNAKVFEQKEWWTDDWDPMTFGFDFDKDKTLNEQFLKIRNDVPRLNLVALNNENSDFSTGTAYCKNCYLINSSENSEDCYYGKLMQNCQNCVDCSYIYDSQNLYECLNVKGAYKCNYLHNSSNCNNCHYSDDLIGCNNCMFSSNLRNANYVFKNKQLSKQEYSEKIKEFQASRINIKKAIKIFEEDIIKNKITKYASIINSTDSFGDILTDDKNCYECYDLNNSEDCRYVNVGVDTKDLMDCNNMYLKPEKSYEVLGTIGTNNVSFSTYIFNSSNILYSQDCFDCKNLFACIGLRSKEYCIFNKQFSKETYEIEVEKIIEKMKETGEWGEYFNTTNTSFPYNDSLTQEYFPVEKIVEIKNNEVISQKIINKNGKGIVYILEPEKEISKAKLDLGGKEKIDILWKTKQKEIGIPENIYFLNSNDLKDTIEEENDDIFKKIIKCGISERPFRITPAEFRFYKKNNIPLPEYHSNERYYIRLGYKPKKELHLQNCTKCKKEFLSVYNKNKGVYCEECYNEEIG